MLQKHVLKYKINCKQNATIFSVCQSDFGYKIMVDRICLDCNDVIYDNGIVNDRKCWLKITLYAIEKNYIIKWTNSSFVDEKMVISKKQIVR